MTRDYGVLNTFPKILRNNAEVYSDRPCIREKEYGIWQTMSWSTFYQNAKILALSLKENGLKRGDKISIIGDNRPNLYLTIAAAQLLGAIPVPCYQDSVADELQYILEHAEVKIAVVEDQEQVDKVLEILDKLPKLNTIFFDDPRGLENYNNTEIKSLREVLNKRENLDYSWLESEINNTGKEEIAVMLYTSGTTGRPKGVLLSYHNIISVTSDACEI